MEEDNLSIVSEDEEEVIDLDERRVCVDYPRYDVLKVGDPKERIFDNETEEFVNAWKTTNHKGQACEKKYWQVCLFDEEGVKHTVYLSRIVAKAFIPNPEDKPFVDHINGDTLNNSLDNLQWATASENSCNRTVQRNNRTTGIKNISLTRNGTYLVRVKIAGKTYSKTVKSIDEAIEVANKLRTNFHGKFAHD